MKSMWSYYDIYKFSATYLKPAEISIQENHNENVVKLYPNPTMGELIINNEQLTMNNVEVFDVYGRCHLSRVARHENEVRLDISKLQAGIYLIRITTESGVVTQKVTKI
jgi:hypothetical protein